MMGVLIRPYVDSDFDLVTSIWLGSWQSTGIPSPVTLDELRERWPQELTKGWIVHVATIEPELVGFLALHRDRLEQLFVAPDHQGRGVGKQLLDLAKRQMPSGFHLTTGLQSRAGRFYEREGLSRGEESVHPRFGHEIVRFDWRPLSDVQRHSNFVTAEPGRSLEPNQIGSVQP
jgi:GNAT superfamily N-acetyltransferase